MEPTKTASQPTDDRAAQLRKAYEDFLQKMAGLRLRRLEYMKQAFGELDAKRMAEIKSQLE